MTKPINDVSMKDVDAFTSDYCDSPGGNALDQYQHLAVRSAIYPGQGTPFGLMYAALGLAEAGEVQNKVKKLFRDDGVIVFDDNWYTDGRFGNSVQVTMNPVSEQRKEQLIKELGGVLWYVAACCQELGIEMSEVAAANLLELAGRAQRGTLGGSGDNR